MPSANGDKCCANRCPLAARATWPRKPPCCCCCCCCCCSYCLFLGATPSAAIIPLNGCCPCSPPPFRFVVSSPFFPPPSPSHPCPGRPHPKFGAWAFGSVSSGGSSPGLVGLGPRRLRWVCGWFAFGPRKVNRQCRGPFRRSCGDCCGDSKQEIQTGICA